jgi:hypothetical protein
MPGPRLWGVDTVAQEIGDLAQAAVGVAQRGGMPTR